MSYCRWSSFDWACDVYCYADAGGGYTTHVAGNRIVGDIPKLPDLNEDTDKFIAAWRKQDEFIRDAKREGIALPHAGETFNDPDLESFLARLLELKGLGFVVPDEVIQTVREEIADERTDRSGETPKEEPQGEGRPQEDVPRP